MFDKAQRRFVPKKTPGPAEYFMEGVGRPDEKQSQYSFPRANRVLPGDMTKPDYDKSMFYTEKGPSVKKKVGGYTISNTKGLEKGDDPC